MKTILGLFAALLLAGVMWVPAANAQSAPQGSYLNTCRNVGMDRDKLTADYPEANEANERWQRTVLDIDRCVGDIANINGRLSCEHGLREGYGSSRQETWREGYGSSRGEEWRDEQRARCWHIIDPFERERCWWGR